MSETKSPVAVSILDREYLVACEPNERAGLIAAAAYIDGKMRDIRNASRSAGLDRIAVMAGLNIAHELMQLKQTHDAEAMKLAQHVQTLKLKLDTAFNGSLKLL